VFAKYQGTGYPNNLPQYFSTIIQNYTATYQAARGNNPSTLYLGDVVQTTHRGLQNYSQSVLRGDLTSLYHMPGADVCVTNIWSAHPGAWCNKTSNLFTQICTFSSSHFDLC